MNTSYKLATLLEFARIPTAAPQKNVEESDALRRDANTVNDCVSDNNARDVVFSRVGVEVRGVVSDIVTESVTEDSRVRDELGDPRLPVGRTVRELDFDKGAVSESLSVVSIVIELDSDQISSEGVTSWLRVNVR